DVGVSLYAEIVQHRTVAGYFKGQPFVRVFLDECHRHPDKSVWPLFFAQPAHKKAGNFSIRSPPGSLPVSWNLDNVSDQSDSISFYPFLDRVLTCQIRICDKEVRPTQLLQAQKLMKIQLASQITSNCSYLWNS